MERMVVVSPVSWEHLILGVVLQREMGEGTQKVDKLEFKSVVKQFNNYPASE